MFSKTTLSRTIYFYGGGGGTRIYKGKEIPGFVKFNNHRGMDGETIMEILHYNDSFGIFDEERRNNLSPFLLLDCYQPRFNL